MEDKEEPKLFKVSDTIYVEVSEFNNETRVDIRRWFNKKDSEEIYRTRKGLNVHIEEWKEIVSKVNEIDNFIKENI